LPGESLPSLLARLAQKNNYPNLNFLLNLGQTFLAQPDSLTCPTRPDTLTMLTRLTRLKSRDLYTASIHHWAEMIIAPGVRHFETITLPAGSQAPILLEPARQQHFWPEDEAQFCPLCLAAQPYHRLGWLLLAAPVCREHHCLLVQTCAGCNARLKISDVVKGQCSHCEFDLTRSPTTSIAGDERGQFSQQLIQSWFGLEPAPDQVARLPHQSLAVLYQVLSFVQRAICAIEQRWDYLHDPFDDAAIKVFPCQTRAQLTPLKSYLLYATALTALLDWPAGFYKFLDAYRLRDQRQQTDTAPDDLGYLYSLRHDERFQHPAYHFLQQAFGQYVQENFQYSFALQKMRRLQPTGAFPARLEYVSTAEAARMLQLNPELIKRLVELGDLTTYQPPAGQSTRRFNLVRQQDVLDLREHWPGMMSLADAARLLRISPETVLALIEAGFIRPGSVTRPGDLKNRSLADFIDRLRQGPVRYLYPQHLELAPLNTLVKQGVGVADLIQRILAGEIRAYWPPDCANLAHLVITVEDFGYGSG